MFRKMCAEVLLIVTKTVNTIVEGVKQSTVERSGGDVGTPTSILVSLTAYHPQTRAPWINVVKQSSRGASFSSDGVQDSDKNEALLGEMGEQGKGAPG